MTENPQTIICRVCLRCDSKIKKKCLSLFETLKNGVISDSINSITDIGIREGDGFPNMICPDCLLELDTAVNFKNKCVSSDKLLKATTQGDNIILKTDELECTDVTELDLETIKKEELLEDEGPDFSEVEYSNEDYFVESENDSKDDVKNNDLPVENVKKSKAIDLKLECHDCGGFFKSKCKLKVHWKKVHMLEKLICQTCKRTFKSFKAYNKHVKSNNNPCMVATKVNVEGMGKNRVFHCKDCSYQSSRIKDMQSHLYTHSGERPFVCKICQKAFTQQSSLQSHQELSHKMYKVEASCDYCGKLLKGRNRLYRHLKRHQENVGVQCDICKKTLLSKKSLILHLQRHTGVKTFTCEMCASTFYTLSELCNHKRMKHEKGKHIFRCDLCDYTALRNETLKKHKNRHTPTNVCCLLCGIFVPSAEALLQHQKRHFKRFSCPYCDLKYARKDSLHKHVRAKHKFTFSPLPNKPVLKTESPAIKVCDENIQVKLDRP